MDPKKGKKNKRNKPIWLDSQSIDESPYVDKTKQTTRTRRTLEKDVPLAGLICMHI